MPKQLPPPLTPEQRAVGDAVRNAAEVISTITLTPAEVRVYQSFYVDKKTVAETAEHVGVKPHQVSRTKAAIQRKIRTALAVMLAKELLDDNAVFGQHEQVSDEHAEAHQAATEPPAEPLVMPRVSGIDRGPEHLVRAEFSPHRLVGTYGLPDDPRVFHCAHDYINHVCHPGWAGAYTLDRVKQEILKVSQDPRLVMVETNNPKLAAFCIAVNNARITDIVGNGRSRIADGRQTAIRNEEHLKAAAHITVIARETGSDGTVKEGDTGRITRQQAIDVITGIRNNSDPIDQALMDGVMYPVTLNGFARMPPPLGRISTEERVMWISSKFGVSQGALAWRAGQVGLRVGKTLQYVEQKSRNQRIEQEAQEAQEAERETEAAKELSMDDIILQVFNGDDVSRDERRIMLILYPCLNRTPQVPEDLRSDLSWIAGRLNIALSEVRKASERVQYLVAEAYGPGGEA